MIQPRRLNRNQNVNDLNALKDQRQNNDQGLSSSIQHISPQLIQIKQEDSAQKQGKYQPSQKNEKNILNNFLQNTDIIDNLDMKLGDNQLQQNSILTSNNNNRLSLMRSNTFYVKPENNFKKALSFFKNVKIQSNEETRYKFTGKQELSNINFFLMKQSYNFEQKFSKLIAKGRYNQALYDDYQNQKKILGEFLDKFKNNFGQTGQKRLIKNLVLQNPCCFTFEKTNDLIYIACKDCVQQFNSTSYQLLKTFVIPGYNINWMELGKNTNHLIMACQENVILVYDIQMNMIIEKLYGHQKAVNKVSFSYDKYFFASCSDDCQIKIWDSEVYASYDNDNFTGHHSPVKVVIFAKCLPYLISGGQEGQVKSKNYLFFNQQSQHFKK